MSALLGTMLLALTGLVVFSPSASALSSVEKCKDNPHLPSGASGCLTVVWALDGSGNIDVKNITETIKGSYHPSICLTNVDTEVKDYGTSSVDYQRANQQFGDDDSHPYQCSGYILPNSAADIQLESRCGHIRVDFVAPQPDAIPDWDGYFIINFGAGCP